MLYGVLGWQDAGKSATAVGIAKELIRYHGYKPWEVIANLCLRWQGSHAVTNDGMRQIVKAMVQEGVRHKILIIDEADRVFPARFWHQAEQTEALLGLWQDEKLFNHIIYTQHLGKGVDTMMHKATQIQIIPKYHKAADLINLIVINRVDGKVFYQNGELTIRPRIYRDQLLNVSKNIFPDYDRWEIIR